MKLINNIKWFLINDDEELTTEPQRNVYGAFSIVALLLIIALTMFSISNFNDAEASMANIEKTLAQIEKLK